MRKFTLEIIKKLDFLEELELFNEIIGDNEEELYSLSCDYVLSKKPQDEIIEKACALCPSYPKTAVSLVIQLLATEELYNEYKKNNISDEIFYNTITDIKRKFIEGKDLHGIVGTPAEVWQRGFFNLTRFALGYFQYDVNYLSPCDYNGFGANIKKGDIVPRIHMPSGGDFSSASRLNSYKLAYEFFKGKTFNDKLFVMKADTWFLYPEYEEIFPKGNIHDFRREVDLVGSEEFDTLSIAFRIWGTKKDLPTEQLPEDTSMQRGFKKHILDKKPFGWGYSFIVFDGENILTKKD